LALFKAFHPSRFSGLHQKFPVLHQGIFLDTGSSLKMGGGLLDNFISAPSLAQSLIIRILEQGEAGDGVGGLAAHFVHIIQEGRLLLAGKIAEIEADPHRFFDLRGKSPFLGKGF
jgi:hypothetical protein